VLPVMPSQTVTALHPCVWGDLQHCLERVGKSCRRGQILSPKIECSQAE